MRYLSLALAMAALLLTGWSLHQQRELEQRVKLLEATAPGVGEVMAAIQTHFAKLYFAGQAHNQDLADFEIGEIEENLEHVPVLRPTEKGVSLEKEAAAFRASALEPLKASLAKGDFEKAYLQTVQSCNACHSQTGHGSIVMRVPQGPPVLNQEFAKP